MKSTAMFIGVISFLLSLVGFVNAGEVEDALEKAIQQDKVEVVRDLLEHHDAGKCVKENNVEQYPFLHWAAIRGNIEIMYLLKEYGANMSATTKKGYTPLDCAKKFQRQEAVYFLRLHGQIE
jgi:ankyrin repeat protein